MTCKEAVYSDNVLDYIVSSYRGEEYINQEYNPVCFALLDNDQAVIYRQEDKIDSESITRFGYGATPHVYGLMAEEALEAAGVQRIRRQPSLDLYGQDILVGIVDTGIDFSHRAFLNADNTTRIYSIWDQTLRDGTPPEIYPYGTEITQEEINEALQETDPLSRIQTRDTNGHGTFMAGIAAGNEMRQDNFSGVAPLSQLIVVKCKEAKKSYREYYRIPDATPCYQENDIMSAISYILYVARKLRKAVVISLGMGTNQGNHDGETPLCNMIQNFNMISGICIVTCAGNEGNARHHYLITKENDEIGINVEESTQGFTCELWWDTPGELQFDVVTPGGVSLGLTRASAATFKQRLFVVENTYLEVLGGDTRGQSRDNVLVFRFENSKAGIWKIRTYSTETTVKFHMWLPINEFLSGETYFIRPDPDVTICEPGNTRRTTTVSAYNPVDSTLFIQASRGYAVSGVIKPDVTAPGVDIYGPLPNNNFGTYTGTSVSAALTTGIAALFMQEYSEYGLSGNAVRELLIRGANRRGEEYPNREWGYGTVDAYQSIYLE